MSDKIYIGKNDKRIELKGDELTAFNNDRKQMQEVYRLFEAEQLAKESARQSAIAKLSKLGLTEDEVQAIVGGN